MHLPPDLRVLYRAGSITFDAATGRIVKVDDDPQTQRSCESLTMVIYDLQILLSFLCFCELVWRIQLNHCTRIRFRWVSTRRDVFEVDNFKVMPSLTESERWVDFVVPRPKMMSDHEKPGNLEKRRV